jgi:hypothetical protein
VFLILLVFIFYILIFFIILFLNFIINIFFCFMIYSFFIWFRKISSRFLIWINLILFSFLTLLLYNVLLLLDLKLMLFWIFNILILYFCIFFYNFSVTKIDLNLYKFYFIFMSYNYKIQFNYDKLMSHFEVFDDLNTVLKDFLLFFYFMLRKRISKLSVFLLKIKTLLDFNSLKFHSNFNVFKF